MAGAAAGAGARAHHQLGQGARAILDGAVDGAITNDAAYADDHDYASDEQRASPTELADEESLRRNLILKTIFIF